MENEASISFHAVEAESGISNSLRLSCWENILTTYIQNTIEQHNTWWRLKCAEHMWTRTPGKYNTCTWTDIGVHFEIKTREDGMINADHANQSLMNIHKWR